MPEPSSCAELLSYLNVFGISSVHMSMAELHEGSPAKQLRAYKSLTLLAKTANIKVVLSFNARAL